MSVERKIDLLVGRFDALERKVDAMDQRFDAIDRRFDAVDQRFDAIDRRFEAVDQRFDAIDRRFEAVDRRFDAIDRRSEAVGERFDTMDRRFGVQFDAVLADVRLVAEGVDATNQRLDRNAVEARRHHDAQYSVLSDVLRHVRTRVERLEEQ